MEETPRYTGVTEARFHDEIKPLGRPAVLEAVAADWDLVATGREGPEALATFLAGLSSAPSMTYFAAPPQAKGRIFYEAGYRSFNFERREAPLAAFLEAVLAEADKPEPWTLYAGSLLVSKYVAGLARRNSLRSWAPTSRCLESVWIGNRTRIPIHYDRPENLAVCAAGERVFTLFPPSATPDLYMGPLDPTPAGQPISLVDPAHPDFEQFPRYARALEVAQIARLKPGDALYIPGLWWHGVACESPLGVLVNYWWDETPSYFGAPELALLHAALALKSLPPAEKAKWKVLFDHLIFETDAEALALLPDAARGLLGDLTPERARDLRLKLKEGLFGQG
jgi:hypothetical protein